MRWERSDDYFLKIKKLVRQLGFSHIKVNQLFVFRSYGSKARAYARIWSLPKIWQIALKKPPGYCLEVISEKFDRLNAENQTRVLIHELLHIPKNFSGSVLSHRRKGRVINSRLIEKHFRQLPRC